MAGDLLEAGRVRMTRLVGTDVFQGLALESRQSPCHDTYVLPYRGMGVNGAVEGEKP